MIGGLREYARHRGVDPATVSQAVKEGRIKKRADGKIEFEKADAAWDQNTAPRVDDAMKRAGGDTAASYAKARAMREAYAAKLNELEYKERLGQLVDAAEVESHWVEICVAIRTAIQGLPQKLAPLVLEAGTLREVHGIIEEECVDILRRLSAQVRTKAEPGQREDAA